MFYYRFRPFTQLSLKELIYDELYFTSSEESNDPYEGKIFFEFEKSDEKWLRLLDNAWENIQGVDTQKYKEVFSKYLTAHSPITFDEIQNETFDECVKEFFDQLEKSFCELLIKDLKSYIKQYKPSPTYFVSFAKDNDNYLMWSHYANKHSGYCLIFKTIDGCILQSDLKTKNNINGEVVGDKFRMKDVIYGGDESVLDAFLCFPYNVSKKKFKDEKERLEHMSRVERPFLEKAKCWEYEKEARLLLPALSSWLCSKNEYSSYERLLNYESRQLVGIILGARLGEREKEQIKEIIKDKVGNWWKCSPSKKMKRIFHFVLFEASLSQKLRSVIVSPMEIYTNSQSISKKDDAEFKKLYEEWKAGWCMEICDKVVRRNKIE